MDSRTQGEGKLRGALVEGWRGVRQMAPNGQESVGHLLHQRGLEGSFVCPPPFVHEDENAWVVLAG